MQSDPAVLTEANLIATIDAKNEESLQVPSSAMGASARETRPAP